MARKIAFVNNKGGVGKSTACFLTALGLGRAGKAVQIEDLDPQKSVTAWIDEERDGIGGKGGMILIDTRPAVDDETVMDAIARADVIVMPCSPSPGDIIGMKGSIDTVMKLKKRGAKVVVLLNRAKPRTRHTRDAKGLIEGLGVKVLEVAIPDRECIQDIVTDGWKAMDPATQGTVLEMTIEIATA